MTGQGSRNYAPGATTDLDDEDSTSTYRAPSESFTPLPSLPGPVPHEERRNLTKPAFHYVIIWIGLSSSLVLFNKWILYGSGFPFPLFLTSWHLFFATLVTQILARSTRLLDSRRHVPMTYAVYLKHVVPIAVLNSLSLVCGNVVFLYLNVSFIEMLKATNAVATLLASWALGLTTLSLRTFAIVSIIVGGVAISSFGELNFHLFGFLIQIVGVVCEAFRLAMVQRLLSSDEFKMDPLVSLYYVAPASTFMIGIAASTLEFPNMTLADFRHIGFGTLLANAFVAFLLNVSVVFLIRRTSAVVMTLCGILKNILIVVASMVLFQDPVTVTQAVGFVISLSGLIYYRLGSANFIHVGANMVKFWEELGEQRAIDVKVAVAALFVYVLAILVVGGYFFHSSQMVRA
ncbi:DUF250 domain membrane protein [Macrophomina phaseolina]|uniref:DUF250 domain membrane protein n=1 Tax=Macrophomina phaseolina TaxID=35725 RepID=A0ABQ8GIQ5_9PEZI|nr:DUF250 domain membrane protein [Macrophomina phaseolina]